MATLLDFANTEDDMLFTLMCEWGTPEAMIALRSTSHAVLDWYERQRPIGLQRMLYSFWHKSVSCSAAISSQMKTVEQQYQREQSLRNGWGFEMYTVQQFWPDSPIFKVRDVCVVVVRLNDDWEPTPEQLIFEYYDDPSLGPMWRHPMTTAGNWLWIGMYHAYLMYSNDTPWGFDAFSIVCEYERKHTTLWVTDGPRRCRTSNPIWEDAVGVHNDTHAAFEMRNGYMYFAFENSYVNDEVLTLYTTEDVHRLLFRHARWCM